MSIKELWGRYFQNRAAVVGLIVFSILLCVSFFGPLINPKNPRSLGEESLEPPSLFFFFGTDDLGRDVFIRVLHGLRVSLVIGLLAVATSLVIGLLFGALSGYCGGKIDSILMRILEVFQVIPRLFLALVIAAAFGSSIWNVIFVIGILMWPTTARLIRAEFLSLKEQPFVEALRSVGAGHLRIMFGEILPNTFSPVVVNLSFEVAHAILLETYLSFLGAGDPNMISLGYMLRIAQPFIRSAWWMPVFPGIAIFLAVLSLNLVGDGLNDALNPRMR